MSKDELITKQQIEIEELKKESIEFLECRKKIHGLLFSIGAPLNDNIDGFSKQQMKVLFNIQEVLGI